MHESNMDASATSKRPVDHAQAADPRGLAHVVGHEIELVRDGDTGDHEIPLANRLDGE